MAGPRYVVLDDTPQVRGLGCTGDELANALRAPLAAVGVRVVRQRGATTKSLLSEFQARGMPRRQYDVKAIQVAKIVDEVTAIYQGLPPRGRRHHLGSRSVGERHSADYLQPDQSRSR